VIFFAISDEVKFYDPTPTHRHFQFAIFSFKSWILITIAWTLAFSVGSIKTFRRACLSAIVQSNLIAGNLTDLFVDDHHLNDTEVDDQVGKNDRQVHLSGSHLFSAGIFIAVFVLPSILLAFIYGRIYMEAHKNLVRIR
jgi:hypothetical protein